jgi:hypothetical protein
MSLSKMTYREVTKTTIIPINKAFAAFLVLRYF